jgi:hypothetical protein
MMHSCLGQIAVGLVANRACSPRFLAQGREAVTLQPIDFVQPVTNNVLVKDTEMNRKFPFLGS